jgi:hypothetical protein
MRRLPVVLGLVLLLGCAALPVTGIAPALAGSSNDQDIADSTVLTQDDVADFGLTEVPSTSDGPPKGAACKAIRSSEKAADGVPNAASAFEGDFGTNLDNQVSVFKTVKAAKAALAGFMTSKTTRCVEQSLKAGLRENLPAGASAKFNGSPQDIAVGDGGLVYTIDVTTTEADGTVTDQYVELGVFRVGRAFVAMNTINLDEPFPGSQQLATMIADNLEAEL